VDHYATLGLDPEASRIEVQRAYRRMVKQCHPDVASDSGELFLTVQKAYEVLSDEKQRRVYDLSMGFMQSRIERIWKKDVPDTMPVRSADGGVEEVTFEELQRRNIEEVLREKKAERDQDQSFVITHPGTDHEELVKRPKSYMNYTSKSEEFSSGRRIPEGSRKWKRTQRQMTIDRETLGYGSTSVSEEADGIPMVEAHPVKELSDDEKEALVREREWDDLGDEALSDIDQALSEVSVLSTQLKEASKRPPIDWRGNLTRMLFGYYSVLSFMSFFWLLNEMGENVVMVYLSYWMPLNLLHWAFSDESIWGKERRGQPHSEDEYNRRKEEKTLAGLQYIVAPSLAGWAIAVVFGVAFQLVFFLLFPLYLIGLTTIYYSLQDERRYNGTYPTFFLPDETEWEPKAVRCPECTLVAGYVHPDEAVERVFCSYCGRMQNLLLPVKVGTDVVESVVSD